MMRRLFETVGVIDLYSGIYRQHSHTGKSRNSGGYCWPTSKCRNLCVQHACFEGKKAEETSPRKSTHRTLKEVGQQYPTVFRDSIHDLCRAGNVSQAPFRNRLT